MDSIEVNAHVKVSWEESGSKFAGVVQSVNTDGTYDVLYNERVGGKACLEKSVARKRIEADGMDVDTNQPDSSDQVSQRENKVIISDDGSESNYWHEPSTESYMSVTDRSKVIAKLLQTPKTSASNIAEETPILEALDNHEVLLLHDALTPAKALEMVTSNTPSVEIIVRLLTASIDANCSEGHAQTSFAELWAEYAEEAAGKPRVSEWLLGLHSTEDSPLSGVLALHSALAGLLRLQVAFNTSQAQEDRAYSLHSRTNPSLASINIAEETIDRAMRAVSTFLNVNFLNSVGGGAGDRESLGKQGSGKGKGAKNKGDVNAKAVADVAKAVFPTVTSVLSALEQCFRSGRQNERHALCAAELALSVLRTDPVNAPVLDALVNTANSVLVTLHRAAVLLLREVFLQHAAHRKGLLVELMAQLCQCYAVKAPYRSYPLTSDVTSSLVSGEGVKYASMTIVALLSCLQSVVSVQESLIVKKHKHKTAGTGASATDNVTVTKGKGKKNKATSDSTNTTTTTTTTDTVTTDSTTDSTNNTATTSQHTAENAKKSIFQAYVCCSGFATDLFQRCTHKEVSGDYRTLAASLVSELLTFLPLPDWPCAAILLEQLLLQVLKQLNSDTNTADPTTAVGNSKKDAPYTSFLLDLLGSACVGLRGVLQIAEQEKKASAAFVLPGAVVASLSAKLSTLSDTWVTAAQVHQQRSIDASAGATSPNLTTSGKKTNTKGSKNTKNSSRSTSPSVDTPCTMDIGTALDALLEITSSTVDAIAETPMHSTIGYNDTKPNSVSEYTALPAPLDILRALPQHKELARLFPDLSPLDLQFHHVCAHLQHSITTHSSTTSKSNPSMAVGSHTATTAQDALEMLLCTWYLSACTEGRMHVADYLYHRLEQHCVSTSSHKATTTSTSPIPYTITTTAAYTHTMDTITRGNYSIEAILSSNRHILSARSVSVMFERSLDTLLHLTTDTAPGVRARAVKLLSALLQCDNDLIQLDHIRFAVTNRLLDRAISVREECVKLLGYYVVQGYSHLATPYLEGLKARLHDEGISVRKSVVLLFKEILLHQPDHPQYTTLCLSLLELSSHPKEEESIKEIIRSTFQQLWFLPPTMNTIHSQSALKLRKQNSTSSIRSASSTNSLTQQFNTIHTSNNSSTAISTLCYTPGSVPALSRASSFQAGEGVYIDGNNEAEGAMVVGNTSSTSVTQPTIVDNTIANSVVSPLSLCSPRALSIDTSIDTSMDINNDNTNPIVSVTSRTPGRTPTTTTPTPFVSNTATTPAVSPRLTPKEVLKDHIRSTALQLIDLCAMSISSSVSNTDTLYSSSEWMVSLLREVLHGSSEGDECSTQLKQRRAASFKYCEQIVACLIELLLCTEEQQPEIMQLLRVRSKEPKDQCVSIICTIALFCTAHPPFISRHLSTLLPYLKHDNSYSKEQNALIKLQVTEILTSTASIDSAAFNFNLTELINDLKKCALNLSGKNIRAAVNCIAIIAENVTHDALPLFQLAEICFKGIRGIASTVVDNDKLTMGHMGHLQRCLIVFGYVCEAVKKCGTALEALVEQFNTTSVELQQLSSAARAVYTGTTTDSPYTNTNNTSNSSTAKSNSSLIHGNQAIASRDISSIELLHPNTIHGSCYAAAVYALTIPHSAVQVRGAQALCGVFAGCPRLMLLAQQEGLLSALLGEKYADSVHERFISAVRDMMVLEEERLEGQQALRLMKDSGVAVIETDVVMSNAAHDAESTIPGFALQQHLPELIAFLSHPSASLRYTTMQLVGTLLRQGMLCPIDVVAPLIALQCDKESKIRQESLVILQIEDEKHPTFISSRMVDGIELCCAVQRRIQGDCSTLDLSIYNNTNTNTNSSSNNRNTLQRVSLLGDFFASCIQHPKRRKELLDGLLHRTYRLVTKLRESIGQHPLSYDLVLQQQMAQQRLIKEEEQAAMMVVNNNNSNSSTDNNGPSSNTATSGNIHSVPAAAVVEATPLKRAASFTSTSTSTKHTLNPTSSTSTTTSSLHLHSVLTAYTKAPAADFIASTLAYLPYDTIEEPLQLVYYINRNVSINTSLLLHRLRQQLCAMGAVLRKAGDMQPPVLGTKPRASSSATSKTTTNANVASGTNTPSMSRSPSLTSPSLTQSANTTPRASLDSKGPLEGDMDLLITEDTFYKWLDSTIVSTNISNDGTSDSGDKGSTSDPPLAVVRICELILLALELRCNEAVLRLKSYIKLAYNLSDDRCSTFNPDERSLSLSAANNSASANNSNNTGDKLSMYNTTLAYAPHPPGIVSIAEMVDEAQLRAFVAAPALFCSSITSQTVSTSATTNSTTNHSNTNTINNTNTNNLSPISSNINTSTTTGRSILYSLLRQVIMDYNRITLLLNSDPEDFTLNSNAASNSAAGNKRKRRPAATPAEGEKKSAGRKAKTPTTAPNSSKKKAKKTRRVVNLSDDEGEEQDQSDDDDWEE